MTGKAEDMRQIAQVLRQNNLPETAVRMALLNICGVTITITDNGAGFETTALRRFLGVRDGCLPA